MFAIVALRCQLSAGAAFLEDFALERKALTLVFQLCVEVHSSSCTKQEVHYVVTWTKQLCALQKMFLTSVKSNNIPQMETSSSAGRAQRSRACNVPVPEGPGMYWGIHSKRLEEQPEQVCKIYVCKFPWLSHLETEKFRQVCSIHPSSQVRCSVWILHLPLGTGPKFLPI